jgi:ABC-type phosphate/phosphonate transport system substrate-binding protein
MALSMCCGWHLLTGAIGDAKVLAQPVWDQPNHEAGTYHSKIVCRREDAHMPLDALASEPVVNGRDSWSGFQTFLRWAAGEGIILGPVQISGGHRNSLTFLREGRGRLATIDSVCWRLAEFVGETDGLTVLGETATQPCPPVIMGAARQSQNVALLEVLQAACHSACAKPWMDAIGLIGFRPALRETYLQMLRT